MIWVGLETLLSHWRRQPVQLAMLVLGLSIATALWTGVQAINAEARRSYAEAAREVGGGQLGSLVARPGQSITMEDFVALRRAGWLVSPVVEGEVQFGGVSVRLLGIEPLTLPREAEQVEFNGDSAFTEFLTPPGLMFVGSELSERLAGYATLPLRIADDLPPDLAVVDIQFAKSLLGTETITRLVMASEQPPGRVALAEIAPHLEERLPSGGADLARLTDSFHLNLSAFGLLSFVVGLFIVYASIGLAFEQRRSLFRTMRALGVPARMLVLLLLAELTVFALLSGILGVVLGYGIAAVLMPDVAATLRGLYGAGVSGALSVRPEWWAAGLAISLAGALAAAAESLWRLLRLQVLEGARPRAWARISNRFLVVQTAVGALLIAAAFVIGTAGSGLLAGLAILGAMLLGAALMLPMLLSLTVGVCHRLSRGAVTEWFWADTRQQLPGLSIALMALLLALATNIGVGAMVSSFRQTFTGYLDQRLSAELYVRADSNEEAQVMADWLAPQVDAVLPLWRLPAELAGQPGDLVSAADHSTFRDNWPMIRATNDAWDRLARGDAVLVNEQLSRRTQLDVGDRIPLPGGWNAPIAGVYSDYGNPAAQVIVGLDAMRARYPQADHSQLGVRVAPDRAADVREAFEARFGAGETRIIDQAGLKRFSLQVFERTFVVTGVLNVLTLAVAGFALFASLMTLSGMRLPQVAPVWAVGIPRGDLARLEMVRTLALASFALVFAIPVGLMLAWVLLSVVNVEAFGWQLPLYLFPQDWAGLGVMALAASALAAAWPMRRLARTPPSELLKVFAHER